MLSRIKIESLFNLYDYDINLVNSDGSKIKFITAPNGFGKTTILNFIDEVMKRTYSGLFIIPFKKLGLFFNEESLDVVFKVEIERRDEQSVAVDTDVSETLRKTLELSLIRMTDLEQEAIEKFTVVWRPGQGIVTEGNTNNIDMFFASRTCYYLTELRTHKLKTDTDDQTLVLDTLPMSRYAQKMKAILESPNQSEDAKEKIEVFKRIIDRCEFANKHLEIDKRFGIRFVSDDALETKLTLDQLSSGEKQMIVQVFELLFFAKDGTLVLIDEPELSLHMMWQMNYLKNSQESILISQEPPEEQA